MRAKCPCARPKPTAIPGRRRSPPPAPRGVRCVDRARLRASSGARNRRRHSSPLDRAAGCKGCGTWRTNRRDAVSGAGACGVGRRTPVTRGCRRPPTAGSGGAGDGGGPTRTRVAAAPSTPSSTAGARPPSSRATAAARSAAPPNAQRDGRRARTRRESSRYATRRATSPRDLTAADASRGAAGPIMASATRAIQRAYALGSPVRTATRSSAASSRSRRIQRPISQSAGCSPNGTAMTRCRRFVQSSRRSTCACSWATT